MASEEAARIIDLYQRKARDWIESRARTRLFEKPWLDRFRALLSPAAPILARMGWKLLWTTLISGGVFGIGMWAYYQGYLNIERLSKLMGLPF